MKHEEFLELLNLYLDHEISVQDAARLEAEVQANPARRALYRDYCRMQKACHMLAADFRETEELPAGGKVFSLAGAATRDRSRGQFFLAGAATIAAACVALIFVRDANEPPQVGKPAPLASSSTLNTRLDSEAPALAPRVGARGLISVAGQEGRNDGPKLTLVDSLVLSGSSRAGLGVEAEMQPLDDQLSWMQNFQLTSIQERKQLDQLRFDAPPPTLRPDRRQLGTRAPAEASVEMTAFRFVK